MATFVPNFKPIVDPAKAPPLDFPDTSHLIATPSNLFAKFNPPSSLRTPLTSTKNNYQNNNVTANSTQITTPTSSSFSNHVIPLTFSATNTPIIRQGLMTPSPSNLAATPSPSRVVDRNDPNASPLHNPNPAAMVSFFRQRSARLSSPIFCDPLNMTMSTTTLCSPVVRANPLAQSDIAAAALPPNIAPIHIHDLNFSLESGFKNEEGSLDLDLGLKAARIPVPYAIRLRMVDRNGPIRPIEARIQRYLEGPQSMFLSVIDPSNVSTLPAAPHSDSSTTQDDIQSGNSDDDEELIGDTFHAFWAAPDTFTETGQGRLLVSVTDAEYSDYEIPINLSVRTTKPVISVEAPGYAQREVRTETNVNFSDFDHDSDALVTVWNETKGDAPLLINIVLEDNAGGAFSIGRTCDEDTTCIPILLKSGCSETFRARFSVNPSLTLRRCYYGSILVKYAFVLQSHGAPGHDLELNQYYDHVVNLSAAVSNAHNDGDTDSRSSMESGYGFKGEGKCQCSDDGDQSTVATPSPLQSNAINNPFELSIRTGNVESCSKPYLCTSQCDEHLDAHVYEHDQSGDHRKHDTTSSNVEDPIRYMDSQHSSISVSAPTTISAPELALGPAPALTSTPAPAITSTPAPAITSTSAPMTSTPIAPTSAPASEPVKSVARKVGRPKLKMPQRVRECGIVMNANQGTVELPLLNAAGEVVEVSVSLDPLQHGNITTSVSPNYLVIGAGEKAYLTMIRTTSDASESLVVLRAATMGSRPGRTTYRVPAHISKSVMRTESSMKFSVDRPTMSFYNPCTAATREWAVRLRNGLRREESYQVWISEGCGTLYSSYRTPAFRLVSPSEGVIQQESFTTIRVSFDASGSDRAEGNSDMNRDFVRHFHGRLNVKIGSQCDFIPLFGFTGSSDIKLRSTELGYVCAKNTGNRYGFIVITGPEVDAMHNKSEKAVLAPGEEREFVAPYGTGSVVYTGDEIARSRERCAEKLRRLDEGVEMIMDVSGGLCGGEFDGEEMAHEAEMLDWCAEDKFSMFYSGRLLDHNMKRYVFDVNDGNRMGFVETNRAKQCGWTVTVEGGYLHLENLEVEREIQFEAEGAEPSCGVIAPLGDAMLTGFRECVDIRAQGRVETIHINLSSIE